MLLLLVTSSSSQLKVLYNPQAFFTHAALLDQAFAHCPIFPTAASRRSLGRVSVPVWLFVLSDQLQIVALVGLYPTKANLTRAHPIAAEAFPPWGVCGISSSFLELSPTTGQIPTRYSPVRHSTFTRR